MPYAAGLVAALTLAGCGVGAAEPAPPATTAVKSAPVSRSTTASSPPAATAGPNFPAGLPDAAKKQTDDGAKAFVQHFIDELNEAWVQPNSDLLTPLCNFDASKSCSALRDTAEGLEKRREHYDGTPLAVAEYINLDALEGNERVVVRGEQLRRNVLDSSGKVVLTDQRKAVEFVFYLRWSATGWLTEDIKVVA